MTIRSPIAATPIAEGTLPIVCSNWYGAFSKVGRDDRAEELTDKIRNEWQNQGYGIVLGQEAFGAFQNVPAQTGYGHHWVADFHMGKPLHTGLAIMSDYEMTRHRFLDFSDRANVFLAANAGVQEVTLDVPGLRKIRVQNTHLQSSFNPDDPTQYSSVRQSQLKQVKVLHKATEDKDSLVVFGGDLNSHPTRLHAATTQTWRGKFMRWLGAGPLPTSMSENDHTPEYDYLVHALHLADATKAVANFHKKKPVTFGTKDIILSEPDYAAAGFELLFDRIHIGTTNPYHRVIVFLDESSIEFEDTGLSDHRAVKMKLSLAVYATGTFSLGPRVRFTTRQPSQVFLDSALDFAAAAK